MLLFETQMLYIIIIAAVPGHDPTQSDSTENRVGDSLSVVNG